MIKSEFHLLHNFLPLFPPSTLFPLHSFIYFSTLPHFLFSQQSLIEDWAVGTMLLGRLSQQYRQFRGQKGQISPRTMEEDGKVSDPSCTSFTRRKSQREEPLALWQSLLHCDIMQDHMRSLIWIPGQALPPDGWNVQANCLAIPSLTSNLQIRIRKHHVAVGDSKSVH